MSAQRPPRSVFRPTQPGLPRSLRDDEGETLDDVTELAPGSQLMQTKSFDVVDRIGEGGMGKIYRAYDPRMDRYVALKVLKLDVPEAAQRRFRREALIAADFSHPNLPRVLDVGHSENLGIDWLTMEYLRGRDLGEVIDRGRPITIPLLVDMIGQTLDALDYIHVRKIVHCDVKPDNIFITRDPYYRRLVIVKLIDFGICRTLDPPEPVTELSGDPRYMAPEQTVLHGHFDHRADFYALGVTVYELITGQHPFEDVLDDVDPAQLLEMQCNRDIPPPSAMVQERFPSRVLDAMDEFVAKSTAKDPGKRYANAMKMKEGLQRLVDVEKE